MAETSIEWATKVWNVTRGCRRVSPGCGGPHNEGGCYAERQAMRMSGPGGAYEGLVQLTVRGPRWTGKGRFATDKLDEPLRWKAPRDGSRHRIFVNSMSDLFFEEFTNEQIAAVFGVMAACPQHDFLVLTKRPERMRAWFAWAEQYGNGFDVVRFGPSALLTCAWEAYEAIDGESCLPSAGRYGTTWPLPNVWLGISAEDQQRADERIPCLLETPAAVRFVSAEPLLGEIDLKRYAAWPWFCERCQVVPETNAETHLHCHDEGRVVRRTIDWVIVGGESGPGARPCNVAWIRSIVEQCKTAGVAAFVKQFGALPVFPEGAQRLIDRKGGDPAEWPGDLRVREMPVGPMR